MSLWGTTGTAVRSGESLGYTVLRVTQAPVAQWHPTTHLAMQSYRTWGGGKVYPHVCAGLLSACLAMLCLPQGLDTLNLREARGPARARVQL